MKFETCFGASFGKNSITISPKLVSKITTGSLVSINSTDCENDEFVKGIKNNKSENSKRIRLNKF